MEVKEDQEKMMKMANKKTKHKNIRDSYNEEYKDVVEKPVDYATFSQVIQLFFVFLFTKVFEGEEVTLPCRLGTLYIRGIKEKIRFDKDGNVVGLSVNWRKTKELWDSNPEAKEKKTRVFNTNEHSSGIRYKFVWGRNRVLTQYKSLYSLRLVRSIKRELHRLIVEENKEFLTVQIKR